MGKVRSNILEIVLKEILIGKEIYIEDKLVIIEDINYQPLINVVFIKSNGDGYKLSLNDLYDFNLPVIKNEKIRPTKGKVYGK